MSLLALRRLRLDAVWWLVSPGNPLKGAPAGSFQARLRAAAVAADHPRILVTGVEAKLGTRFTADLLSRLRPALRRSRPVWIMGADNLADFQRWRRWRAIAAELPVAVTDRPGWSNRALAAPAARALARARRPESTARLLPDRHAPAWVFLHGPRLGISSTALRRAARGEPP